MSLEKRLDRLEDYCPKHRTIEDMTDDELAEIITGIPGTKASELTDEYLQAIARGEQPIFPYQKH